MPVSAAQLIQQIHNAPIQVVLAASGGGSRAIAELLEVPGASRTMLEAVVPYGEGALVAWLGGRPEQFCSLRTARAMAVVGLGRALKYGATDDSAAAVACSASLATDRPKRGAHRAHVALQTAERTTSWSIELLKGRRIRGEEEQLVSRMVLNAVADACRIDGRLDLPLLEGEQIEHAETTAPRPWQDLLLGKVEAVREGGCDGPSTAIFPGAFNPLHVGHQGMAQVAGDILGLPVSFEISILNVDKPPLDYAEIEQRVGQFQPDKGVWLTRAATFEEKSRLFPGATFVVGVDTLERIAAPHYYADVAACRHAMERIASRGCRFLVFSRDMGSGLVRLSDLDLPDALRGICQEVPPQRFREDISSTALRKADER
jgi:nicotinamide mononucleotide (NMN) deamidase PncC